MTNMRHPHQGPESVSACRHFENAHPCFFLVIHKFHPGLVLIEIVPLGYSCMVKGVDLIMALSAQNHEQKDSRKYYQSANPARQRLASACRRLTNPELNAHSRFMEII